MERVWIVFADTGPGIVIQGIFDDEAEAHAYARMVASQHSGGAKTSEFPVPWRALDNSATIETPPQN